MPVVNPLARELVFKIVYYGPGLGGKTTTLQHIHATTKPEYRGKMVSLATPVDRTLYFDFLPIRIPNVRNMSIRLQLFTVPGQVYYNATRKLVLTGADGVVFVVDSQRARIDANLESLENLKQNLREHGRSLDDLPHVIQLNKRDLEDVYDLEELEKRVNPTGAPCVPSVATTGRGVYESLDAISRAVLQDFEKRMPQGPDSEPPEMEMPDGGLAEALKRADSDEHDRTIAATPVSRRTSGEHDLSDELAKAATSAGQLEAPASEPATARVSVGRPRLRTAWSKPSLPAAAETPAPESSEDAGSAPPATSEEADEAAMDKVAAGFSLAALWPVSQRSVVVNVELALSDGQYARAVELCEQLVTRCFAGAMSVFRSSEAPRDPVTVPVLLGLDGRRYLEFRALARDARDGRPLAEREALGAYVFATEVRLAHAATRTSRE